MTIANRLLFGFMVGVLLLVSLGIYALGQIREVRDEMTIIVTRDLSVYRELTHIRANENDLVARRLAILAHYYAHDFETAPAVLEDAIASWNEKAREADGLLAGVLSRAEEAGRLARSNDQREMFNTVASQLRDISSQFQMDTHGAGMLFQAIRQATTPACANRPRA